MTVNRHLRGSLCVGESAEVNRGKILELAGVDLNLLYDFGGNHKLFEQDFLILYIRS